MADINGRLETIAGRVVEGWATDLADPALPVLIEVRDGDLLLGSTLAAGSQDGRHRFGFLLPLDVFDGTEHVISVRAAGAGTDLQNSPLRVVGHDPGPALPDAAKPALTIPTGSLDLVSDEGWVMGWAWYPNSPAERVEIEFLIDGALSGSTVAASYRADVAAAGVGDGNYGYSWALPYHVLTRARESLVIARDKRTGHVLPEPRKFRQLVVTDAVEKVTALEHELRQLTASIGLAQRRERADQQEAAELFRIVGDFFVQLAAATAAGEPPGSLRTLRNAVTEVTSKYRPFAFELPAAPAISLCIEAVAPLAQTYQQLRAIRDSLSGKVEVILLDGGMFEDVSLLPLVVRNIRYLRLDRTPLQRVNDAMQAASADIVVYLADLAVPMEGWLDAVRAGFVTEPAPAALAAQMLGADGVLEHAGVTLAAGEPVPNGRRRDPGAEAFAFAAPVEAVAATAFAVRRDEWLRLHGLDESYTSPGAALADFCLRLRDGGGTVLCEPGFAFTQWGAAPAEAGSADAARDDSDRLRQLAAALAHTPAAPQPVSV